MSTINEAYINALLADAAYRSVNSAMTSADLADELSTRLTETQAAYLAANFTVVTSIETPKTIDPLLGTGFDAAVWQIKAGSELAGPNNVNAGKLFVSMRGTQGLTDSADDITLASRGIPYDQIRDMVNWWLKNTAAVTNTAVKQRNESKTIANNDLFPMAIDHFDQKSPLRTVRGVFNCCRKGRRVRWGACGSAERAGVGAQS
ncbi:MAG: hypothetical protein JNK28_12800 [Burkholderiaceae bacterium]|nr:hypothetical protein [Burkholderiaceae bacterium]